MLKAIGLLNNWKMVLAWVLTQLPDITSYPGLLSAIQELIAHSNRQTIINFLVQALMAIGVAHRVKKNISE